MGRLPSLRLVAVVISLNLSTAAAAIAQSQPANGARWEVEGHAGLGLIRLPAGGTSGVPEPGAALTSTSPIFPSRRTSSWFFGDGASMINDVNAVLGIPARLSPLDPAFASLGAGSTGGATFGLRVRRLITPRMSGEISIDLLSSAADLPDALAAAAESSRASFETTFAGLLNSGPFTGIDVDATSDVSRGSGREIAVTGALGFTLGSPGGLDPYVTLGGGVIRGAGSGETIALEGRYRATTSVAGTGNISIDETDRVRLRYGHATTYVAVAGGGLRHTLTAGWGIRVDARVFIGANNTRLLLDADPSTVRSAPAGFIETLTYPNIQFSTDPASGRTSTLSGPALDGFEAFTGGGPQTRVLLTVGIVRRF